MKLVMTLLVRDEADILEANLDFHLSQGVDFVIATDNNSEDETPTILERYARRGLVHVLRETGDDYSQRAWVTRMARLAAADFGADWVINNDADELWWPKIGTLKDALALVPSSFGAVIAPRTNFVPRPERSGETFFDRMIFGQVRGVPTIEEWTAAKREGKGVDHGSGGLNWGPHFVLPKVAHRATPDVDSGPAITPSPAPACGRPRAGTRSKFSTSPYGATRSSSARSCSAAAPRSRARTRSSTRSFGARTAPTRAAGSRPSTPSRSWTTLPSRRDCGRGDSSKIAGFSASSVRRTRAPRRSITTRRCCAR